MSKHKISILYVENEKSTRETLIQFLKHYCKDLYIAQDGKEGLKLYEDHRPDIVISAINLPKIDGLNMIKAIKSIDVAQLVILVSSYNDSELLYQAINLGVDGYILKPIDMDMAKEKLNDLTQRIYNRKDAKKLKENENKLKLFSQAVDQMNEMVHITDMDGNIIYVNPAAIRQSQYKKNELIGQSNKVFQSGVHSKEFYKNLWEIILSGKKYHDVFVNKKKDGSLYYDEKTITPLIDEKGNITHFVSTGRDITERIELEKKLKKLATKDTLTGIYNRYKINKLIESEITRSNRYDEDFSLLMLDIDNFKKINDTYGHDIGDYILQELSRIILNIIRETDCFGRWGGEEFMLVAPHTTKDYAVKLGQKIRISVMKHNFEHIQQLTVSMGVTQYSHNEDKTVFLKRADKALYEAKANGRNQVVFL